MRSLHIYTIAHFREIILPTRHKPDLIFIFRNVIQELFELFVGDADGRRRLPLRLVESPPSLHADIEGPLH